MLFILMLIVALVAAQSNAQLVHFQFARNVMVALTVLLSILSYVVAVQACSETYPKYLRRLLRSPEWYVEELRYTLKVLGILTGMIACAAIGCYLFGYTVFWPGIAGALIVAALASILCGILGTIRGIDKYAHCA